MTAEIDKRSGFCFGVQNAVQVAEEALLKGEKVYSLGPIVHNDKEVERLSDLGLVTTDQEQFRKLSNCKVLIRAHGEPPDTYLTAEKNNITIIEATCPIVKKLQSRIRKAWLEAKETGGQVVIFGKKDHAEVAGLLGHTENEGILITGPDDLDQIDTSRPISLFSQTTMHLQDYQNFAELLRAEIRKKDVNDPDKLLTVNNTICEQIANREPHLSSFAGKHDVVVFVSGRESSNGRMLYSICKSINPDTYFVSSPDEIDKSWFDGKRSAGICGATSTPKWLIEQVYNIIAII
jgi:4-hydroxy-3-methylbut-2-enyl diphosphate reductase